MKRRKYGWILRMVSLTLCLCLLATGCKNVPGEPVQTTDSTESTVAAEFSVQVVNASQEPVSGVGVYVYTNETKEDLVWFDRTNDLGKITFQGTTGGHYIAVLADVTEKYLTEESYPITEAETVITLADAVLTDDNMESVTYKLGDTMLDFSVTACDGTEYTLSQLLKEKDAVVLNFWYENCGPCGLEFPYLQEAYALNGNIAVLAMNPVDGDDASIAAYREKHGLTFPMAKCDAAWEKMMQITGYPTTVVVDRSGVISLIHTGSVPDAKTFSDAFTFFTASDYTPTLVENIEDLRIPEEEQGTQENPLIFDGVSSFEVTVRPGQEVYCNIYKAFDLYLSLKDKDAYVIYNGKTHRPSSGTVSMSINCKDSYSPVELVIGNTGTETKTFTVKLANPRGSLNNPYTLKLEEFTTKSARGNDQGVYYEYKAVEDGVLTVTCRKATDGVDYDYMLYNLSSYAFKTMGEDGGVDENGNRTISIAAKKGQRIRLIVAVLPDSTNSYPKAEFTSLASFGAGDASGEDQETKKVTYTLSVRDVEGNAMANVYIKVTGADADETLTTGEDGKATAELVPGSYTAVVTLPNGYTTACDKVELTQTVVEGVFLLEKQVISSATYSVTVLNPDGAPVENAVVLIGSQMAYTDAAGKASMTLDVGEHTVYISGFAPEFATDSNSYTFAQGETDLTVNLIYKPGTQKNPITVTGESFTTNRMSAGAELYYRITDADGKTLTIADEDASVTVDGVTYTAENGVVTVPLTGSDVVVRITNNGSRREAYTVNLTAPQASDPTEPDVTDPTKPDVTDPTEPDVTDPTEPDVTDPTGPDVTDPTGPDVTDPTGPDVTDPTGPDVTDPTEPDVTDPTGPDVTDPTGPDVTDPTGPDVTDPTGPDVTDPTVPDVTDPVTEPSTEPTEPEITYGEYTVTVTDYQGAPASQVMVVILDSDGAIAANGMTDSDGVFVTELDYAAYRVQLAGTTWYYEASTAVLSATKTELTILLSSELTGQTVSAYVADSGAAYQVNLGGTHVKLGSGAGSYSTDKGVNFFAFVPTEPGIYRFTTSNPNAKISDWGSNPYFFMEQPDSVGADNSFTSVVQKANLGATYFVGVSGTSDVTECVLEITRLGDPAYDPQYVEPTVYQGTSTPRKYTFPGGTLTYVNVFGASEDYTLVYNQTDGYYHLGTVNGPVMMIQLGTGAPYVSLDLMINGDGVAGGTSFRAAYYDSYGNYVKEDYTQLMMKYIECMDTKTGVYPLTKDLVYMLQKGCAYNGWTDSSSPSFLFLDRTGAPLAGVNSEIAWMFACCYVQKN